jgi:predicted TIM-barrel fold metal-dependent hydrolase
MKFDLHTHYYPESFFQMIRDLPSEFSFDKDPTGRTIIKFRSARFFGITAPMSDPEKRLEDMDRVGIDVEVLSLSTPNVFFAGDEDEVRIARTVNDAYAELIAAHPSRFHGFASIPMDVPDEALKELHRALDDLKMNGVILISNIKGRPLTTTRSGQAG